MKRRILLGLLLGLLVLALLTMYAWAFNSGIDYDDTKCDEACVSANPTIFYESAILRWVPWRTQINGQETGSLCLPWDGDGKRTFVVVVTWRAQIFVPFPPAWVWTNAYHSESTVLHLEKQGYCTPKASASASVGTCTWDAENGSRSDVTLTLDHAVVHAPGGDITHSTVLEDMPSGDYKWPWEAKPGYRGNGYVEFKVKDCTPEGSASYGLGTCQWSQETGSQTPVTITISHAVVHSDTGDLTETTTLSLVPGPYSWDWEATEGYQGSGTLSFEVPDCSPGEADYTYTVSACQNDMRTLSVHLIGELSVAVLNTNGEPLAVFTEDGEVDVPAGVSLTFIAKPAEGYILVGPARVEIPIASCKAGGRPYVDLGNLVKIESTAYPYNYCYVTAKIGEMPGVDAMKRICESAGSWLDGVPRPGFIDFANGVSSIAAHGEAYFTGYDEPWGYWEGDPFDRIRAPVLAIEGIGRNLRDVFCATNGEQVPGFLCP